MQLTLGRHTAAPRNRKQHHMERVCLGLARHTHRNKRHVVVLDGKKGDCAMHRAASARVLPMLRSGIGGDI